MDLELLLLDAALPPHLIQINVKEDRKPSGYSP